MPDVAELSAVWPSLKLFGERGLLLLRFRPHTWLPLVRNPEHALGSALLPLLSSRHQCLSRNNEHLESWRRHSTAEMAPQWTDVDERIDGKALLAGKVSRGAASCDSRTACLAVGGARATQQTTKKSESARKVESNH